VSAGGGEVDVRTAERHGLRGQQLALAAGRVPGEAAVGGVGVKDGLLEQRRLDLAGPALAMAAKPKQGWSTPT
jgi:hypothetical protein